MISAFFAVPPEQRHESRSIGVRTGGSGSVVMNALVVGICWCIDLHRLAGGFFEEQLHWTHEA